MLIRESGPPRNALELGLYTGPVGSIAEVDCRRISRGRVVDIVELYCFLYPLAAVFLSVIQSKNDEPIYFRC